MTYKYEHDVINELEELEDEYKINYKNEVDEICEVYRKAKAFDNIVEVYSDNDHYSDEYVMEIIQEQIDDLERADDEG